MIRLSFCTIAFQANKWGRDRRVETPLEDILPILAEAGYDAAELWGPHVGELSDENLDAVREQMERLGLAAALVSPYFDFTTSEERAAASIELGRETIEQARRLGARGVRCFTGKTGSDEATEAQWARAVDALRTLADAAGDDLLLVLETHGHNLMDTVDSSLELLGRADRGNVGLIYQPTTFGPDGCLDAMERLGPHIRHVHASNRRDGQRAFLDEGDIDYGKVFAGLERLGFDGYVSVEWMGDDPAGTARREAQCLRRLLAQ